MADEYRSPITPAPGAVWCDEVGVVTGDLELRTTCGEDGAVVVDVRYADADEWYRLSGASCTLGDPADARGLHDVLVAVLHRAPD